ncbi:pinin/SDK/memA/ protein conserved region-domain-containing protein [Syncephalis plumigaleata]|nr:pinin/SDK/memA/ protein conserved region-domain-containing protein [Syncephalis plumigaleata]
MSTSMNEEREARETNAESALEHKGDTPMDTSNGPQSPVSTINKEEVKQRSRRMLGVMLGTLNSIKKANENKSEAMLRREALETKLQDRLFKEKEEIEKKREAAQEERRQKALEARRHMYEKRQRQSAAASVRRRFHMAKYLKTKTGPELYYLPAKLTDVQHDQIEKQINEIKTYIDENMPRVLEHHGYEYDDDYDPEYTDNMNNTADGRDQRLGEERDETIMEMEAELTANQMDTAMMDDTTDRSSMAGNNTTEQQDMDLTER